MPASLLRSFALFLLVCSSLALPLDDGSLNSEEEDSGTPSDPLFREVSGTSGCTVTFTVTIFQTKVRYLPEKGIVEKYNDTVERNDTKCCEGWTNLPYCNQKIQQPSPNVCNGVTCEDDPSAVCAIVKTKCGKEVPVFISDDGQISTKCNLTEEVTATLSCTGFCAQDPCEDLKCPAYPDGEAVCFTSGCDCKPVWFSLDGVEVDCASGEQVPPEVSKLRKRRQASGVGSGDSAECPS